jgi:hypothetical protein
VPLENQASDDKTGEEGQEVIHPLLGNQAHFSPMTPFTQIFKVNQSCVQCGKNCTPVLNGRELQLGKKIHFSEHASVFQSSFLYLILFDDWKTDIS